MRRLRRYVDLDTQGIKTMRATLVELLPELSWNTANRFAQALARWYPMRTERWLNRQLDATGGMRQDIGREIVVIMFYVLGELEPERAARAVRPLLWAFADDPVEDARRYIKRGGGFRVPAR